MPKPEEYVSFLDLQSEKEIHVNLPWDYIDPLYEVAKTDQSGHVYGYSKSQEFILDGFHNRIWATRRIRLEAFDHLFKGLDWKLAVSRRPTK